MTEFRLHDEEPLPPNVVRFPEERVRRPESVVDGIYQALADLEERLPLHLPEDTDSAFSLAYEAVRCLKESIERDFDFEEVEEDC